MTVDEVRELREYIMTRTAARGGRAQALADLYEDVLDEIANNPNGDECCALARAAIGADDETI